MTGHHRSIAFASKLLALSLAATLAACGDPPADAPAVRDEVQTPPEAGLQLDVPFVPTPPEIVARMLEMGSVGPEDHLIDLGSGDGRIVIAAVRDRGAWRAEGIDLDPQRVAEARENATAAEVNNRATFEHGNLFDKDFSSATVLTLYLTQEVNLRLRPRILATLAPGSRVVSHFFDMGAWVPDQHESMGSANIYAWTVPARVEGRWEVLRDDASPGSLELEQSFQMFGGTAFFDGQAIAIIRGRIDGGQVSLQLGERTLEGVITADHMTLTTDDGDRWQARREPVHPPH